MITFNPNSKGPMRYANSLIVMRNAKLEYIVPIVSALNEGGIKALEIL